MVRKKKYIEIGDELSAGTAFIQASHALDVAAFMAEDERDTETLMEVARIYIAIGERLLPDYVPDDEEDREFPFGFAADAISDIVIDVEEDLEEEYEESEEDEDEVSDRV